METFNLIKKSFVICFASVILACGAETLAIIFIPALAGDYTVEAGNGYKFNLQSNDQGKESGVITGNESNHPSDPDKDFNELNGSFNGLNIEFTIERPNEVKVRFTGKMTPFSDTDHNIKRIVLNNPTEGELILIKDDN